MNRWTQTILTGLTALAFYASYVLGTTAWMPDFSFRTGTLVRGGIAAGVIIVALFGLKRIFPESVNASLAVGSLLLVQVFGYGFDISFWSIFSVKKTETVFMFSLSMAAWIGLVILNWLVVRDAAPKPKLKKYRP